MTVAKRSRGYASPAPPSVVLVLGPVSPSAYGVGRAAILALTVMYQGPRSLGALDFHERLRAAAMIRPDRNDPARIDQEIPEIRLGLEPANQAVASSLLAYTLYQGLPNKHFDSFKTMYTPRVNDQRGLDLEEMATSMTSFYSMQLRRSPYKGPHRQEKAFVTGSHCRPGSMRANKKRNWRHDPSDKRTPREGVDPAGNFLYCHRYGHAEPTCRRLMCEYCEVPRQHVSACYFKKDEEESRRATAHPD